MKAVTYYQYGSPDVLKLEDIPKPIPKNNEILIKVKATTVNSADVRIRKADPYLVRLAFGLFKPNKHVLGIVIAGIVEAVGENVTSFKIGDEVFGLNVDTLGANAEYMNVKDNTPLSIKPANLSFEESASLVFGGHTALHFLKKTQVKKDQSILIYGASGSVGTSAIQIAKYYGAKVTAVTSTENLNLVKNLGADEVIDYTKIDVSQLNLKYDIVYETVDKIPTNKVARLVKNKGVLILGAALVKGMIQGFIISKKVGIKLITGVANVTSKDMQFLKELAEKDVLKPVIDKTFILEEMVEAHKYVDKGHKRGNVVIKV
jgi:NADPH:quinone reductase-like Zn-dependent oxidoreductase